MIYNVPIYIYTGFQGWTYAVDFCAKFYPIKRWNSCVRRRKWYRNRIYTGTNSWCIISPLHKDFTQVFIFFREIHRK